MFLFSCLLCKVLTGYTQVPMDGLDLWLRADSGVQRNGNAVKAWQDLSGHHRDAVTRTTDAPEWLQTALNGHSAIRFNGANNGMETPAFIPFPGSRGMIIVVARINGRSLTSGVGMGNLVATYHGNGLSWQFGVNPEGISFYDGKGAHNIATETSSLEQWQILTLLRDADTTMKLFRGGRLEKSFSIIRAAPASNTLKVGYNGRLGGLDMDSIPEVLNGDIAEVLIYGRAPGRSETEVLYHYLTARYGLQLRPPPFWERTWFYFVCGSLLLLLAVLLTKLVVQRKLRKELEKQQEMDKERQRISREMHDDIGAGLTQIAMMSEAARKKGGEANEKELVDIAQTSRTLVNNMSEIIWSLNPEYKTLAHLMAYLREQLGKQLEYAATDYQIRLPDGGEQILLSNEQRRNILLVTREIVNNAIKHAAAGKLVVECRLEAGSLHFEIRDDGKGFDAAQLRTGNGLRNIRQRVQEMDGTLELETSPGKGTCYQIRIPLPTT